MLRICSPSVEMVSVIMKYDISVVADSFCIFIGDVVHIVDNIIKEMVRGVR